MENLKAIVQKVIREGKHGPYAVATSDQVQGSVTFSLEPTVWKEADWPEQGMAVFLERLRQMRAGWRAKTGRFWQLSDEQTERSREMQFLYPTSRQYPIDEVCEKIVRELELRNWQVPDMEVEFHDYGSGEQMFRVLQSIKGTDFYMRFGRPQRTMDGGHWNDTAAISEIGIPRKILSVFNDESGPTFYLYVGKDWEKDQTRFFRGPKVNSRLRNERRIYLRYSGRADEGGRYTISGQRSPFLVHDDDLGREYSPRKGEPHVLMTEEVMQEFNDYLSGNVLAAICTQPVPDEKVDILTPPEDIPFPESIGPIFCFAKHDDAERIVLGKADASQLPAYRRYGLIGNGIRLLALDLSDGKPLPEIAHEGFTWCGIGPVYATTAIEELEVFGHYRWPDKEQYVVRVMPNRANEIYIADHAVYEKRRQEIGEQMKTDRDFTEAEVRDFMSARARTIVPINEYRGGYEQPIVLLRRNMGFDEVELVSGPHPSRY